MYFHIEVGMRVQRLSNTLELFLLNKKNLVER